MRSVHAFGFVCALLTANAAMAQLQTASPRSNTAKAPLVSGILPAAQAFALSAFVEADGHLALLWEMPNGYYLYRQSLRLELPDGTLLDTFIAPTGTVLEDEYFGKTEVYFSHLLLRLPLNTVPERAFTATADGARQLDLLAFYQGCAQEQYCYPPQQMPLSVALPE
ncbi:MAG: protein-disulfide reductase DsbD N-terminal domain-containing protein [Pseudomonadales bacterium]|jgi:thiol:disulfide interchange protein DsbD|nr:protein-disulfide reductase DsbD N-terminal domain-containing protein [Pseudomonadales bacterium]